MVEDTEELSQNGSSLESQRWHLRRSAGKTYISEIKLGTKTFLGVILKLTSMLQPSPRQVVQSAAAPLRQANIWALARLLTQPRLVEPSGKKKRKI